MSGAASGTLAIWDEHYPLLLADELLGERQWLGELYLVTLDAAALRVLEGDPQAYDHALTERLFAAPALRSAFAQARAWPSPAPAALRRPQRP